VNLQEKNESNYILFGGQDTFQISLSVTIGVECNFEKSHKTIIHNTRRIVSNHKDILNELTQKKNWECSREVSPLQH
jgi:hypothetical protein